MSVLSVSNDEQINASFYDAFRLSADYLGMDYGPVWHGWLDTTGSARVRTQQIPSAEEL